MNKTGRIPKPFWSNIDVGPDDECWPWQSGQNEHGYGVLKAHSKRWLAHRWVYTLCVGEIPPGTNVMHSCDNPPCCNPHHLFIGTQLDNIADRHNKSRSRGGSLTGEKNPSSKLTEQDIHSIRQLAEDGLPQNKIAQRFSVSEGTVSMIIHRKTWHNL